MEARNILALVASPQKGGNTDTLTMTLLKSANEQGAMTEVIYLVDKLIKPCTQCEQCHQDISNRCRIDDDFGELADKMVKADIIVLATPIWWSCMHSLLKLLLDRCYSLVDKNWGNFKLQGKGFVIVACQAQKNLDLYVNPFVKEFEVYQDWLKFKVVSSLVASAAEKRDVASNEEVMDKAVKLGKTLAQWNY